MVAPPRSARWPHWRAGVPGGSSSHGCNHDLHASAHDCTTGPSRWSRLASHRLRRWRRPALAPDARAQAAIWGMSIGDGPAVLHRSRRSLALVAARARSGATAPLEGDRASSSACSSPGHAVLDGVRPRGARPASSTSCRACSSWAGCSSPSSPGSASIRAGKRTEVGAPHDGEQRAIRTVLIGLGALVVLSGRAVGDRSARR